METVVEATVVKGTPGTEPAASRAMFQAAPCGAFHCGNVRPFFLLRCMIAPTGLRCPYAAGAGQLCRAGFT